MKPEFENIPLVKAPQQYEIEIDGSKAFITYRESSSTITLLHTEVEPALQGMGASTAVIEKTLAAIEESGKSLIHYVHWLSLISKDIQNGKEL